MLWTLKISSFISVPKVDMGILALVSIFESYIELLAEIKKKTTIKQMKKKAHRQWTNQKNPHKPQVHPQPCVLIWKLTLSLYLSFALQVCFNISAENRR